MPISHLNRRHIDTGHFQCIFLQHGQRPQLDLHGQDRLRQLA